MIFCYNPKTVGDVLLVIVADGTGVEIEAEKKGQIVRVYNKETSQTLGWNIFSASKVVPDLVGMGNGAVDLTEGQLSCLNQALHQADFEEKIIPPTRPHFVVGYVAECEAHPDSDHLSITKLDIGEEELLQVVCGASNIRQGLKVVVATPGTMMPNGLMIWPGKLRGVESFGMICSAKELELPNELGKKGILELPEDVKAGTAFQVNK